jgi:hypothetical protein
MLKIVGEFKVVPVQNVKAYAVMMIKLQSLLTSEVDGCDRLASGQGRFTSRKELLTPSQ